MRHNPYWNHGRSYIHAHDIHAYDWSAPDGTVYPIPPAPNVLESSPKCKKWYVIEGGDTCLAIAASFDVTKTQIDLWNTYINMGCTNIWATYVIYVSSPLAEDYWSLVGCVTDSQSARGLLNRITVPNEKSIMTPKICTDACAMAGYRLVSSMGQNVTVMTPSVTVMP